MLTKARLRNYQRHKDREFEFGPRVTTIVGGTDDGKTTLLRALEWLFLNVPPRGPAGHYVRHGASRCVVSAVVDGTRVTRGAARKGGHFYRVGKGPKLKAVGRGDPPPSVRKVLNLDEDNFQRPYDMPFWLTLSAGQVGRNLNSIVDLSIMDMVLARAVAESREADRAVKDAKSRVKQSKEKLGNLSRVTHFARRLRRLKAKKREWQETALALRRLRYLVGGVVSATEGQKAAHIASQRGLRAIQKGKELAKLDKRIERIKELVREVRSNKPGLPIPDIQPLLDIRKRADEIAERAVLAEGVLNDYLSIKREVRKWRRRKDELAAELERRVGKRCPLCKQKVPKSFSRSLLTSTPA